MLNANLISVTHFRIVNYEINSWTEVLDNHIKTASY